MQSLQRHHKMLGELFVKGLTHIVENLSGRRGKHSMEKREGVKKQRYKGRSYRGREMLEMQGQRQAREPAERAR